MSNEFSNSNFDAIIRRGYLFLEDGSWEKADEYFEKALDIFPECAEAYLGKLMAELRIPKKEVFKNLRQSFEESDNYKKFIRFASDELKAEIESYNKLAKERHTEEYLESVYKKANDIMKNAVNEQDLVKASVAFRRIINYKDSKKLEEFCRNRAEELIKIKKEQKEKRRIKENKIKRIKTIATLSILGAAVLAVLMCILSAYLG